MEVASKCVICGAVIPLKSGDDLRIICDKCKKRESVCEV